MLGRFSRWLRARSWMPQRLRGAPAVESGPAAPSTSAADPTPPVVEPDPSLSLPPDPVCGCEQAVPPRSRKPQEVAATVIGAVVVAVLGLMLFLSPGQGPSMALLQVGTFLLVAAVATFIVGAVGNGDGYLAGIWLTSVLSPWILAIVTVIAYLAVSTAAPGGDTGEIPLLPPADLDARLRCVYVGIAAAALFIATTGLLGRSIATRSRAQAHVYDQLRDRRSQLRDRHARLAARRASVEASRRDQFDTLMREATSRLAAVECELCEAETGRAGLRWARATGYSSILRSLHRVEEMILAAQPEEAVIGDAFNDYLSLTGSTIAQRETLLADLRAAAHVICPDAAKMFLNPTGPGTVPTEPVPSKEVAREVLREIRFAINDFRDSRVDKQIGSRNSLVLVILAGAIVTYLLLGVAILAGASVVAVLSASVYFLVAALAGLLNRLRIEASRTTAVEDYGLGLMRLVAAPLLSGLAGVGGVYLIAKSPDVFGALFRQNPGLQDLTAQRIFDVTQNEAGLIVAVIFGFVPAAFFSSVERQADRFQSELEKSEPSGGSSLAGNATT
jgi:hypothetical protein